MLTAIKEAVSFIREKIPEPLDTAIILGTGLGRIVDHLDVQHVVDYESIPHFPVSTVESHEGKLIAGKLGSKNVLVMQGRFHYYEGYEMQEVIFPIRVMNFLGIKTLIVSNAAGGMNPEFKIGDIMVINDHICLMPNPLIGKHDPGLGARFPDMSQIYDLELIQKARSLSEKLGIPIREGWYVNGTRSHCSPPARHQDLRRFRDHRPWSSWEDPETDPSGCNRCR